MSNSNIVNLECDVVVIGAGGSGLMAGVSTAEYGAKKVIILEKALSVGGNARLSGGFCAVESPAQKKLGINVTLDEVYKLHMDHSRWRDNPVLIRTWMRKSRDVVQWFEDNGIKFNVAPFMKNGLRVYHTLGQDTKGFPGNVPQKGRQVIGVTGPLLDALTSKCKKLGIEIIFGTPAKKILTDKRGKITGVLAANRKDGKEYFIKASAIIVGTGGFARNPQLLKKFIPGYEDAKNMFTHSLGYMTGDGYLMTTEIGAATDNLVTTNEFSPHHYPYNPHLTWIVRRPYLPWVNKNGERFIDESVWIFLGGVGWAMSRQPGNVSFALLDSMIKQRIMHKIDTLEEIAPPWIGELDNDLHSEAGQGRAKIAESWDEIAGYIGANPEKLKATIKEYNIFCDMGQDGAFGKDKQYLLPLRSPPYYAIIGRRGFDVAIGGIKINHNMEVLDTHDNPIAGLYAIGNDAGGSQGDTYNFGLPGSSFGFALSSGYISGKNAADYINSRQK